MTIRNMRNTETVAIKTCVASRNMVANRRVTELVKSGWFSIALLLLVTVCSGAPASVAQTNTFPTTGNVGIGTTSPHSQLGVNGNITFGDGAASGTYGLYFVSPSGGAYLSATFAGSVVLSNLGGNIILSSSYVGIGTTSPGSPLDVYGQVRAGLASAPSNFDTITVGARPQDDGVASIRLAPFSSVARGWKLDAYDNNTTSDYFDIFDQTNGASRLLINNNGNVGIGTTTPGSKLEVNGNIKLTSGSGASITFPDGTVQSTAWTGSLCGGDYAESVNVSGERKQYEAGDVLVIDPSHPGNFLKSTKPYSRLVAGIYSTKPGLIGRRQTTTDPKLRAEEVPMAMVGIVPTKVTAENGPIEVGDLMVTSSQPGYAMKGTDGLMKTGAVIGKALGSLSSGTGVIEVLVSLQ